MLAVHAFWLDRYYPPLGPRSGQDYEGVHRSVGSDVGYYLDGALSILELEPVLKFNNKREPILSKAREIKADDFPSWAKFALALYPYPSFKFGDSLLAALLTLPFPQDLFATRLPRMAFTNYLFNAIIAASIFFFVWSTTGRVWTAMICGAIPTFDYSNIHNSYSYMSHTSGGLALFLLALAILVTKSWGDDRRAGYFRFGLFAFLLSFGVFTSSHVIIESALLGVVGWAWVMLRSPTWATRFRMTFCAAVGAILTPAYILGVEAMFNFKSLGLPTYFAQIENYSTTVSMLIATYPLYARQIWDLRLFNPFAAYMAAAIVVGAIGIFVTKRFGRHHHGSSMDFAPVRGATAILRGWAADPRMLLVLPFLAGLAVAGIYSQPVSRAMTAHLVMAEILLGMLLGRMIAANKWLGGIVASAVICLCVLGAEYIFRASPVTVVSFSAQQPLHTFFVHDQAAVASLSSDYFKRMGHEPIPNDRYRYINKDLTAFLDNIEQDWPKIFNLPKGDYDKAWIAFDALELVATYTPMRRFWKQFTPRDENLITPDNYRTDFRLINTLFQLANSGALENNGSFVMRKFAWTFSLWDQEYNYTLGYLGGVRPYLVGSAMQDIDLHAVYFFNVGALHRAIATRPR